ncbi:MAG: dockerin type I repeat-containing protein [Clostridia bacterium]|nr:dockerin type I repeat-containing protein [Clostridia bacterium]
MKRFLSLLLTVAMLATMFATMVLPASAEGVAFNASFDTSYFANGNAAVIVVPETADASYYVDGWSNVAFVPTSEANTFEVVEGPINQDLDVPENGFVLVVYTYAASAELALIGKLSVGDTITLTGVDFENKTVAADATIDCDIKRLNGNVAYGKSYTTSELYRMGGADVNWGYDPTKNPTYPDENGVTLTDGITAVARRYDETSWVGLHDGIEDAASAGYAWVNVDLDGNYSINEIEAYVAPSLGSGVSYPDTVTFVAIDEEGNETIVKEFAPAEIAALNSDTAPYVKLSAECDVVAAKIEVRLTSWNHNAFTFISEVAAFGEAYVAPEQGGESSDDETDDDNDEPAVGTMENPAQITLGVGDSTTITVGAESEYYFNLTLPQFGVGYVLTVTGNTGFRYGTGMGMPIPDTNGSYTAQVAMPRAASGIVINTTTEEQTYTLTLGNLPAGSSYDNPAIIEESGDYKVTEIMDQFQGYFYQFTAPSAGTITVTMNDEEGWTYSVTNNTTSVATDQHWCDDDPVVSSETLAVAEGDVVIIVVNVYNSVEIDVDWTFTFTAATGDDDDDENTDDPAVGTMENPAQITLGVGESTTITVGAESDYYFNLTLPQMGVGYVLTVTGNTGFRYGTGMGMPIPDTNGSYSAQVAMPRAASGIVINTTTEEQTYTLTLGNLPVGSSQDNPEIIEYSGEYKVTEIFDEFQGYFYQFTAPAAGTITVTMNDVDGWMYSVTNNTTSIATDMHWWDDDPVVDTETMTVEEGDVIIIAINAYAAEDTEINWYFSFSEDEAAGENYVNSDVSLEVGTNDYDVSMMYQYTIFDFTPSEIGKYTISSNNAVLGIVSYNGMWVTIEPSADTVDSNSIEWECTSEGQSIWVAVMADTNVATITVSMEEITINQPTLKDYENTATPEDFVFEGDIDELEGVDYEDDVIDTAVLGDDGYYHLNSADGPIIYVNLNDDMLSLIQAASYGQLSYTDLESNTKIDFTDAFQEYVDAAGESAIYPLTADLMEILTKVCEQRGWASFFGSENEDVWMALCYTMPESDVEPPVDVIVGDINGNGKIDARDYLLLKRAYFGTYTLTCASEAADINGNGKIDARDYLLLKRAYFGTYTIAE